MSRSASQTPNMGRKFGGRPASNNAGGVNEDFFYDYFSEIVSIEISSSKELEEKLHEVVAGLGISCEDWEKRIKYLKSLQEIVCQFNNFEDSISMIRDVHLGLQSCLSDLRSQVVREACLTVAYMAHHLKIRLESTADFLVPQLFVLVPNSARVISSSAQICLTIIVRNIMSSRVLHHILASLTSKSNNTRRFASHLLESVCSEDSAWSSTTGNSPLARQLSSVGAAVDRGVSDADQETRACCRRALAGLAIHWPYEMVDLINKMESNRRILIEKDLKTHHPLALQTLQSAGVVFSSPTASTVGSGQKKRTTIPPSTLKLGTNSLRRNSAADTVGYNSLNRPRAKPSTGYSSSTIGRNKSNNLMTTSQTNGGGNTTSSSRMSNSRGSNTSLSSLPGTTGGRQTPLLNKKSKETTTTNNNTNSSSNMSRNTPTSQYKYRPSGAASASLPRRKNMMGSSGVSSNNNSYLYPSTNGDYQGRRRSDTSDDNLSETSSVESSELSRSSMKAQKPTDNVSEMIRQLSSYQWSDKRDGLINLQNLLNGGRLSPSEVKKLVEVLNTLFSDTKSKIFPLFLSTVQLLIETHQKYLSDWLYPLLLNLISRQAGETVTGRQRAIQDTLHTVRTVFPMVSVISSTCRIIGDSHQNSSSNVKLKIAVLNYLKSLIIVASESNMQQAISGLTPAVNVMVEWTTESKWSEIRKLTTGILIKMQEIHPPILETISHCLSIKVRHKIGNIVKNCVNTSGIPTSNGSSNKSNYKSRSRTNSATGLIQQNQIPPPEVSQEDIDQYIRKNTEDLQALSVAYDMPPSDMNNGHYRKLSGSGVRPAYRSQLSDPPTSVGMGAIPSFPRQVQYPAPQMGAPPQQPAAAVCVPPGGHLDPNYMINRYQSSLRNTEFTTVTMNNSTDMLDQQRHYGGSNNSLSFSGYYPPYYDPSCYSTGVGGGYLPTGSSHSLQDQMYSGPLTGVPSLDMYLQTPTSSGYQILQKISELTPKEMVSTILTELCYINQKHEQRKACLLRLVSIIRDNTVDNWDELFKTTLMRLFESVQDNDAEIRSLSLRVIQELAKYLPSGFDDFTHITILKVLQAHKDPDKVVIKTAEECANSLARNLSHELCIRVLSEMINENDIKTSLAALKMLLEVIRSIALELLSSSSLLSALIPGLVRTTDHEESHIRKASIFCLVEMHRRVGDGIWDHLTGLTSSKARLLQLYIDKNRNNARMTESTTFA